MPTPPSRISDAVCRPVCLRSAWNMRSGLVVFLFVVAWSFFTSVVVVRLPAGGRPAASHLFCFAKKGDPKKATQSRCPAGARLCRSKNGERSKLATLKQASFLIHFLPGTSGSATCEFDSKAESKTSKRRVRHAHRLGSTLSIISAAFFYPLVRMAYSTLARSVRLAR